MSEVVPEVVNKPESADNKVEMITATNKEMIEKKTMKKKKNREMKNERKIFLKQQHLKHEKEMSARNTINFRRRWREIKKKVRMPEMKEHVNIAKKTFDRELDIKYYCAQLTIECLEKCEVQRRRNLACHMEAIEKFISLYHNRLDTANMLHQDNFNILIDNFTIDIDKIKFMHDNDETVLRAIVYEGNRRIDSILNNANGVTVFKLENARNDGENLTKISMLHLEEELSSKRHRLEKIITTYLEGTRYRRSLYDDLKAKDVSDRKIIASQLMRTTELFKSIQEYKNKILKLNEDADETMAITVAGKYKFHVANQSLIERFRKEKRIDQNQLNILTMHYNLAIKDLQHLVRRTRAMLFLIRSCRKLQIQSEKILPVQLDHVNSQSNKLDIFWYRVGLAQVLTNNLRRDHEVLKREKDRLQECLKYRIMNR